MCSGWHLTVDSALGGGIRLYDLEGIFVLFFFLVRAWYLTSIDRLQDIDI